jgi:hypothetical protein
MIFVKVNKDTEAGVIAEEKRIELLEKVKGERNG